MKPTCARCAMADGDCIYPESRRKPAFKRRNVKELEERLAQVEVLLQRAGEGMPTPHSDVAVEPENNVKKTIDFDIPVSETVFFQEMDYSKNALENDTFPFIPDLTGEFPGLSTGHPGTDPSMSTAFGRELMDLGGITESLPPFEVMEDLNRLFFQRQQQFAPIIHPARYLQSFYSAPHMKPPMCGMLRLFPELAIAYETHFL
ncbi:hypothetical protein GGR57DRAFT_445426 [Xylariaceae sp. FL1272]|nr:hypothetical protein GGR57DRAFT_445426 [Xylariaceae sp. FL1272]